MEAVAGSELTVLVDHQAATLHPIGLVVRPHLQSPETAGHIAELVASPSRGEGPHAWDTREETNGLPSGARALARRAT